MLLVRFVAGMAALLLVMLGYRKVRQRQVAEALTIDTPNGISEESFVVIGGIEQWIQVRGENRDNPVLLVLHGGPGWPNAVFTERLRSWERHFTVVQWDHRGAGKTLARNGKAGSGEMTFDRRISDAIELAEYLRQYLRKDKLILLAESMGTLTGIPLVKRRPDLFLACVVTDMYVDLVHNEALKYQLTLERVRASGNRKALAELEEIGGDPARWNLREWNVNMGWAFRTNVPTPNLDRSLLLPLLLTSPIYGLRDVFTLLDGFQWSTSQMFEEIMAYDARRLGTRFRVPFFIFQGESDVITLTGLAEEYFNEVEAPMKAFALIKESGHFAAFTHPERFLAELVTRVSPLASAPSPTRSDLPESGDDGNRSGTRVA